MNARHRRHLLPIHRTGPALRKTHRHLPSVSRRSRSLAFTPLMPDRRLTLVCRYHWVFPANRLTPQERHHTDITPSQR